MSLIEELAARLYAASATVPLGEVVAALDRMRATTALLMWVRTESSRPVGVPQLAGATEHLEHAGRAMQVAQEAIAEYLAALGIGLEAGTPEAGAWRTALRERRGEPAPTPAGATPQPLGHWWASRVAELTGGTVEEVPAGQDSDPPELLRRVARLTRAGDRDGLRRALIGTSAPVGLALAAITPAVLYRLAGELLGHQPRAADLPALERTLREPVAGLLPGLPPQVLNTQLARVCRVPPRPDPGPPAHPTDPAVTGAVLVGALLQRLGRDPDSLTADAPSPLPQPSDPQVGPPGPQPGRPPTGPRTGPPVERQSGAPADPRTGPPVERRPGPPSGGGAAGGSGTGR
jgi:hypothetical protein